MADFNGDGKSDLVTANWSGNTASVLLGNGNGTFQAKQSFGTGSEPHVVAVADFNGDGKSDLVTADYGDNTASVLLGNGNGTFQAKQAFGTGAGPESVAVGDFNGDGKSDLVTADYERQHRERAARQRQRYVSGQAVLWHRSLASISRRGRLQRRRGERPGNRGLRATTPRACCSAMGRRPPRLPRLPRPPRLPELPQ